MIQNYFQGTIDHPYHLSIGAVVRNEEGNICCHYFEKFSVKGMGTFENFVLLMRETIEQHESIEECLARGLMEEFGMKAELKSFIGSIVSKFKIHDSDIIMEKTTLYFLCDFISMDMKMRKKDDVESGSEIKWFSPEEIISKMKEQGRRYGREDADESSVIEKIATSHIFK